MTPDRGERITLLKKLREDPRFMEFEKNMTLSYWKDKDQITPLLCNYYESNRDEFDLIDFDVPYKRFTDLLPIELRHRHNRGQSKTGTDSKNDLRS